MTIVIRKRDPDTWIHAEIPYESYVDIENKRIHGCGSTIDGAVGCIIRKIPKVFNIKFKYINIK